MTTPQPFVFFGREDKTYYPGETVTGTVVFNNAKPLKMRSVSIGSSGKAQTWNICAWEPDCKKHLFRGMELVWSANASGEMGEGLHEFPFTVTLPKDCPPTFTGLNGQNKYKITVFIDVPWKFMIKINEEFMVSSKLDVPAKFFAHPENKSSWFYKSVIQAGLLFKEGPVTLKVSMPSLAFTPGRTIYLDFHIINGSCRPIKKICAKFCERTHYHARHQHTPCKEFGFSTCPSGYFGSEYSTRKIGSRVSQNTKIAPFSTQNIVIPFTIPSDIKTPTFESGLITHGYFFELGIQVENSWLPQYMTAKIYIGDQKDEEEKVQEEEQKIEEKSKEQEAFAVAPPPAYTP